MVKIAQSEVVSARSAIAAQIITVKPWFNRDVRIPERLSAKSGLIRLDIAHR